MIDDKQGLRDSRPHGAAGSHDRNDSDVFADFATSTPPAVSVVVKRRRGTAELQVDLDGAPADRAPESGPAREERRPRVYQVQASAPATGSAESAQQVPPAPAARALERDDRRCAEPAPDTAAAALPARRRRARRNPAHAPGEVTRIVFEPAPPAPSTAGAADASALHAEFIEHPEVGYERVMAELQELRAKLDLALSARRFRIG